MGVTSSTNNNLNQVTAMAGGGLLEFTGTVNEPAAVTVGGNAATVDASGNFRGTVSVTSGTGTVAVVATDGSGNAKTQNYQITVPTGTSRTLTYDLNGNMTNDGKGKTYAWDAANRLIKITYGSSGSTEFTYDGMGRRVKIVEKNSSGTVTSDKRFVWSGLQITEERDSSNTVVKRFFGQGVQVPAASSPANKLFYTRDHLGSIRELTDNNATVRGRWDYDAYGRRSANLITSSPLEADFGYTGHYFHSRSGLHAAPYRFYDADLGKWLARDPIAESGGINLYGYVGNNSVNFLDPLGLDNINFGFTPSERANISLDLGQDGYSVGGHGNEGAVWASPGKIIPAADLAKIIQLDPNYDPKKPVYLNACYTGGPKNDKTPNYAQQLADALDNTVHAPNNYIDRQDAYAILNPFTGKTAYPFGGKVKVEGGGSYVPHTPSK